MKFSYSGREAILMCVPALLVLGAGLAMSRRPIAAPIPTPAVPTPTPVGFWVELKQFSTEEVNPANAREGVDTCVTMVAYERNAPSQVEWHYARRLVALKNGKAQVLWSDWGDATPTGKGVWQGHSNSLSTGFQAFNVLFKLHKVPPQAGDIIFVLDAVARPVAANVPWSGGKSVAPIVLDRLAKNGGLRLTRRLILRRDGQQTTKPAFTVPTALQVKNAIVKRLAKPDEYGNEIKVTLYLLYTGNEAKPRMSSAEGLVVYDENHKMVDRNSDQSEPQRVGEGRLYSLSAGYHLKALRGARKVLVTADVHDGKNWLVNGRAFADVPQGK
jgi:hypothetical protein